MYYIPQANLRPDPEHHTKTTPRRPDDASATTVTDERDTAHDDIVSQMSVEQPVHTITFGTYFLPCNLTAAIDRYTNQRAHTAGDGLRVSR